MHLSPTTPLTISLGTASVVLTAVIGLAGWLWQMRCAQDQVSTDLSELKQDVKWIQRHMGRTDETAAYTGNAP